VEQGKKMVNKENSPFTGLKLHNLDVYPYYEEHATQDIQSILRSTEDLKKRGIFYELEYSPIVNLKFRVKTEFLTHICQILKDDNNFLSCDLVHQLSDIGLPNYLIAKHLNESILIFDGIIIRSTREITTQKIQINEILKTSGYPSLQSKAIDDFFQAIHKDNSKFPNHGIIGFAYYTFTETDWDLLGLKREGEAQGCLYINDPHIITNTALIFTEFGKEFLIFFGNESTIHEMICLEVFIRLELVRISSLFKQNIIQLYAIYDKIFIKYGGLALENFKIIQKMENWNEIKKMMIKLYEIIDITENAQNYSSKIKKIVDEKFAFFNGPAQLIFTKDNTQNILHHRISNFFEFRLNESSKIENLHSQVDPLYLRDWSETNEKIRFTKSLEDDLYNKTRDLQMAYQTEFTLYALYSAICALVISIVIQIL